MEAGFDLFISATTIDELLNKCRTKPDLAKRIPEEALLDFVSILNAGATLLPDPEIPPQAVTLDPKETT